MLVASLPGHSGRGFEGHSWWGLWGGFLPLLLILTLVAVWALARNMRGGPAVQTPEAALPLTRTDSALEEARLRYARGEIRRDEFLGLSRDLQGDEAAEEQDSGDQDG